MQQQDALQRVEGAHNQQVERAVVALCVELVERLDEARGNVPLEAILQLEEFAKGSVAAEVRKRVS